MRLEPKNFILGAGTVLLGSGLIAGSVLLLGQDGQQIAPKESLPQSVESSYDESAEASEPLRLRLAAAPYAERQAAHTFTAVDITLPKADKTASQKAELSSYTMLLQNDVPVEKQPEPVVGAAKSKKKTKKAKTEEAAAEAAEPEEASSFDAVYKSDKTKIYNEKPEKIELKETRSVADEYYSIYDIISGSYRTVSGHELLCQMVYNEIGSDWDDDAIKAQTVAAYSHLRFCDEHGITTQIGMKPGYPEKLERLVSSVEGQAMFYNGSIINAVYSASTAGYSVESERIWDMEYPYLRCVVSEYDKEDPYYGLETVLNKYDVKAALENVCGISMSDNAENWFHMEDIYSGRYVGYITIDGQTRITCRTLQDTFDLQSQAVRVEISGDNVIFRTFGWGHGVGMSQWGCCGYAKHGWSYDMILRHYYIGTELKLSEPNGNAREE